MTAVDVTEALVHELAQTYCNWGKWGPHDEIGTLNYVTEEHIRAAAALCVTGKIFSLAIPLDASGPQTGELGRVNPLHTMLQDGGDVLAGAQRHLNMEYADDAIYMPLQCGTQWDSLAHVFHKRKMYNGFDAAEVTSLGAAKNGIEKSASRFVGRGVLLDLPRFLGVDYLEPSFGITSEHLESCAKYQETTVGEGDFLLLRTGNMHRIRAAGSWDGYVAGPAAGLSVLAAPFLCERHIAAVATDTWTVEVWPPEVKTVRAAMHVILLVSAGIHLGEMFDLERLSSDCATDRRYDFLFVAQALPVTGGVGSPINPTAVK